MKQIAWLSLLILMSQSILGMDNEIENLDCCGLGNVFYNVAKYVGRNDFFYLVSNDNLWFLKKKIASKESFENMDKYYIRVEQFFGDTDVSIVHTPLQQAIAQGNFKVVRLLCFMGADIRKKIKSAQELERTELSTESYPYISVSSPQNKDDINNFKDHFYVGCSAIEFAENMAKKREDKLVEREEIAKFLRAFNKKD